MASFVYFIPERNGAATNQMLIEAGMGYAILGASPVSCHCNGGPGGEAGLIVVAENPVEARKADCNFLPAKQTWRKSAKGNYWVGFENDRRPAPDDLGRESMYDGQSVTFDDGSVWVVPRCYGFLPERAMTLPLRLDMNESGQWVNSPAKRFESLCQTAMGLFKKMIGVDKEKLAIDAGIEAAVAALAVNYRISGLEIAMLSWSSDDVTRVCRAMVDADEVERVGAAMLEKKRAADAAPI